jgi:dolichol-phosphate mannosyltransferase
MDLTIVIPALNEAQNITLLIKTLSESSRELGLEFEILVIDGGSEDETRRIAQESATAVRVIQQRTRGYGAALMEGFAEAAGEYLLTVDADLSHDPSFLRHFWTSRDIAEVIIGSRYMEGGSAQMPILRKVLSKMLNQFFRRGLSLPCKDLSSGFRLYRTSVVKSLKLKSVEFDILEEILIRILAEGWRVAEIPIRYVPRKAGKSHAKLLQFGIAYLKTFGRMWKLRNSIEFADYDARAHDSIIPLQRYWQRRRRSILEDFAFRGELLLDIGCGSNQILGSDLNLVGMDILLRKLRYSKRYQRPLVNGSIFALPFLNQAFDCVICSEVIEHIPGSLQPFLEIKRVLKPGGTLVLGTPDYAHRTWRIIEAVYRVAAPGGYADEHITHYTRESLGIILANLGFTIHKQEYIVNSELIVQCTNDSAKINSSAEAIYNEVTSKG